MMKQLKKILALLLTAMLLLNGVPVISEEAVPETADAVEAVALPEEQTEPEQNAAQDAGAAEKAETPEDEVVPAEESAAEESVAEEPVADESATEESATEEPAADEPATEESAAEEPAAEDGAPAEDPRVSAAENADFTRGYAMTIRRSAYYADKNDRTRLGTVGTGVLYVTERANDKVLVLLFDRDYTEYRCWMNAADVYPMADDEVSTHLSDVDTEHFCLVKDTEKVYPAPFDVRKDEVEGTEESITEEDATEEAAPEEAMAEEAATEEAATEEAAPEEVAPEEVAPEEAMAEEDAAEGVTAGEAFEAELATADIKTVEIDPVHTLGVGESLRLASRYLINGVAAETEFTYATGNKSKVTVTSAGKIKAVATGSAVITVKAADGTEGTVTVTVVKAPTSVKLTTTRKMGVGETITLTPSFTSGQGGGVSWKSGNEAVATVDENGCVKAVAQGSTKITVRTYNGKTATCTVNVYEFPAEIHMDAPAVTVGEGDTVSLALQEAYLNPVWEIVSGSEFASLDGNVLVANKAGQVTLRASVTNGSVTLTCIKTVTIIPAPVTILLGTERQKIGVGEIVDLQPVAFDANGNEIATEFTLKSSSTYRVKTNGTQVKGYTKGTATVTVTAANGVAVSVKLTVMSAPTKITLSQKTLTLAESDTAVLTASLPKDQTGAWTWETSDENVVSIDDEGRVLAIAPGKATVTVKTYNGKKAECAVTVLPGPDSLAFEKQTLLMAVGTIATPAYTCMPEEALCVPEFSIEDPSVATVDPVSGRVTAVSEGVTVLHVNAYNIAKAAWAEATMEIEVTNDIARIEAGDENPVIGLKETLTLAISFYDSEGRQVLADYSCVSSNKKIATVKSTGIYGAGKGTADVTVMASNGVSTVIHVTVKNAPASVKASASTMTLSVGESAVIGYTLSQSSAGKVTFTSDSSCVTVAQDGTVKAVSTGSAKVTLATYNGKKATVRITVKEAPESISFAEERYTVKENATIATTLAFAPTGSYGKVTYEITDTDAEHEIAKVSPDGVITGVTSGEATLTVRTWNYAEDREVSATCAVTVVSAAVRVEIGQARTTIGYKERIDLLPVAYDARGNVVETTFKLKTQYGYRVSVKDTTVYGAGTGSSKITVTAAEGVSASVTIKCVKAPTSVSFDRTAVEMALTWTEKIAFSLPSGQDGAVTLTSSDENVVLVDQTGKLTAVGTGSATVTATTYNGKKATCAVTVYAEPTGISFADDPVKVAAGDTALVTTTYPEGTLGKAVYSSSDESIATVDPDTGSVTAIAAGTCTITARTQNGLTKEYFSANCELQVTKACATLAFVTDRTKIGTGESVDFRVVALDEDGNEVPASVKYAVKSTAILRLTGSVIKGGSRGSSKLTATAYNGVSATRTISVVYAPNKLTMNNSSLNIVIGYPVKLEAKLASTSYASAITWTSSDESIVTVDQNGNLTPVAYGQAVITATTYNGKKATCKVSVFEEPHAVELSSDSLVLGKGQSVTLGYTLPDRTYSTVSFTSSDPSIATVDSKGTVKAVSQGTAVITLTLLNGVTAQCAVEVKPAPSSIKLSQTKITIGVGQIFDAASLVVLTEGSCAGITYKSSSSAIAAVNSLGQVKGVKTGSTSVTVKTHNGKSATLSVKVVKAPTSVALSIDPVLYRGDSAQPVVTFNSGAMAGWTLSASNDAVLIDGQTVIANKIGNTTLTVTTHNGLTATCEIEVRQHAEYLTVDQTELELTHYDTAQLTWNVLPTDAYDRSVRFVSSDPDAVSVDANGLITAREITDSDVTISVITNDQELTKTVTVRVLPLLLQSIAIGGGQDTLEKDRTHEIEVIFMPALADNRELVWSSSDPSVISVDGNGCATAHQDHGTVSITAHAADGSVPDATVVVTATKVHITGISADEESFTVSHNRAVSLNACPVPSDAELKNVTYTSNDTSVVTVSDTGELFGVSIGSTTVKVEMTDSFGTVMTKLIPVTVEPLHPASIEIASSVSLRAGSTRTVPANVLPTDADDKSMSCSVSDSSVATAGEANGIVTICAGADAGETVVTLKTNDGNVEAHMTVSVVGSLGVTIAPNHALNTTGNDVEWSFTPVNAIDYAVYSIVVTLDGAEYYRSQDYESITGYTIPDTAAGEYRIAVTVRDGWGDTATGECVVTVSDECEITVGSVTYRYIIEEQETGEDTVSIGIAAASIGVTKVTIPSLVDGMKVTGILDDGFAGMASLEEAYLPGTIRKIGDRAFKNCPKLSVCEKIAE